VNLRVPLAVVQATPGRADAMPPDHYGAPPRKDRLGSFARHVTRTAAVAALSISLVGCHGAGSSTTTTAAGGAVAGGAAGAVADRPPCVVGAWRSEGFSVDTTRAKATGGGGFLMTIDPAGQTVVDFAGMRPVTVKASLGDLSISSHMRYAGRVSGKLQLPPAGASTGPWTSDPAVDWTGLRVTIDIDGSKIYDNVSPAEIAKEFAGTGHAAPTTDTHPVLGAGTYTCAGDKLTVAQQASSASATWTLHREG
jgi:hypothetical protein